VVFFFKQKTAYEVMPSLVGSEMCIKRQASRRPNGAAALTRLSRAPRTCDAQPVVDVLFDAKLCVNRILQVEGV